MYESIPPGEPNWNPGCYVSDLPGVTVIYVYPRDMNVDITTPGCNSTQSLQSQQTIADI